MVDQPGILSVKVSLLTSRGTFEYDPTVISAETIQAMVNNLGFASTPMPNDTLVSIMLHIGHLNSVKIAAFVSGIDGVESVREVDDPSAFNSQHKALIADYNPDVIGAKKLVRLVSTQLGFAVLASSPPPLAIQSERSEALRFGNLLVWSFIFSFPVAFVNYIMPLIYSSTCNPTERLVYSQLSYRDAVGMICATPIVFFVAYPIHESAVLALWFSSRVTMDVLISLSSVSAYVFSVVTIVLELSHVMDRSETFFEVSALLITLILFGRYIEKIVKARASNSVEALMRIQAKTAILLEDQEGDRKESYIDVILVERGDLLKVLPGARVPTDGVVVEGASSVDESMITGESRKVAKQCGSVVIGGTINAQGVLVMRVTHTVNESMLARIVHLVDEAQSSKCASQSIADVVSSHFTTFIIGVACIMFVVWYELALHGSIDTDGWAPFPFALRFAITILVISCPCAISLAVPTAIIVATTVGSQIGVLFKSGVSIETLEKVDVVMFDKTGTLTNGELRVVDMHVENGGKANVSKEMLWQYVASAEQDSEHAIGKAIVNQARDRGVELWKTKAFTAVAGCGVECMVMIDSERSEHVCVGSLKWMRETLGLRVPSSVEKANESLQKRGCTVICVSIDKQMVGVVGLKDAPRGEARFVIEQLKARRIQPWIVTGDQRETALGVAEQLGIPECCVLADALPHQKVDRVRLLESIGKKVAFVGDGVNDGPALAMADVGIAVGAGTDVAIESADLVLVKDDLTDLLNAMDLSRSTTRLIKWNFTYGFLYNMLMMPIACGALYALIGWSIPPAFAGLSELFSSVPVILFSLLLNLWKPKYGAGHTKDQIALDIGVDIDNNTKKRATELTPLLQSSEKRKA